MTDEAYVFNSTVAERSALKNSAHHKKNGPAVAKLGNKRMTAQEIKERHGECNTYNLDEFMSFNEFKAMPNDIQVEYVNKLQEKYDIGILQISRYLFHLGDEGLQSHLRINGILNQCNPNKRRAKVGLVQFQKDIEGYLREKKKKIALEEKKKRERLGNFITYEEYQELDLENKIEYINSLVEKYGVSINVISIVLFGQKKDTLGAYFCGRNVRNRIKNLETRCNKAEKKKVFEEAVNVWRGYPDVKDEELPFTIGNEKVEEVVKEVGEKEVSDSAIGEEIFVEESDEGEIEEVEEPVDNRVMSFKYSFVGDGSDLVRFRSLGELFCGKKVRVNIEIVEVE